MSRNALIVYGGWDGHHPKEVGQIFDRVLKQEGFETELSDTLDAFRDEARLKRFALIVPHWTMGTLAPEQAKPVFEAVKSGVGIAGIHGGMCDAFRTNCEWQFMTGGQWVAHPGNDGVRYTVNIKDRNHPITEGISDFVVASEQYYMHVDPAVKVLATCRFPTPGADGPHLGNDPVDMPVLWTKLYGKGRVFYSSLGHHPSLVEQEPHLTVLRRGLNWAARS